MEREALYNKSKAYYEGSGGLCAFVTVDMAACNSNEIAVVTSRPKPFVCKRWWP